MTQALNTERFLNWNLISNCIHRSKSPGDLPKVTAFILMNIYFICLNNLNVCTSLIIKIETFEAIFYSFVFKWSTMNEKASRQDFFRRLGKYTFFFSALANRRKKTFAIHNDSTNFVDLWKSLRRKEECKSETNSKNLL